MENEKIIEEGMFLLIGTLNKIKDIYFSDTKDTEESRSTLLQKSEYFRGVAEMLSIITGVEYQWSTPDGIEFSIVIINKVTGEEEKRIGI